MKGDRIMEQRLYVKAVFTARWLKSTRIDLIFKSGDWNAQCREVDRFIKLMQSEWMTRSNGKCNNSARIEMV